MGQTQLKLGRNANTREGNTGSGWDVNLVPSTNVVVNYWTG